MSSMKYIFAIFVLIFSESSSETTLNQRICSEDSLEVDTLVRPFGTPFVYLIAENLIFKLEIKNSDKSEIKSSQTLQELNPKIRQKIQMIYTTKRDPKYISLINCAVREEWIIRYEDNHYNGSAVSPDCGQDIEYVIDDKTGDQFFLRYLVDSKEILIVHTFGGIAWSIRSIRDDPYNIKAIDKRKQEQNTDPFSQLEGHLISAAFIYDEHWYLFAGRYYCRVNMVSFEKCQPKLITEWISNCDPNYEPIPIEVGSDGNSIKVKNKDIAVYVIIVMVIVAICGIVITFICLLTCKEYRRGGVVNSSHRNSSSR